MGDLLFRDFLFDIFRPIQYTLLEGFLSNKIRIAFMKIILIIARFIAINIIPKCKFKLSKVFFLQITDILSNLCHHFINYKALSLTVNFDFFSFLSSGNIVTIEVLHTIVTHDIIYANFCVSWIFVYIFDI